MPYSYEPHFFDDFEEGQTFDTVGRTVTETDFVLHSAVSGNWSELSTNKEYASDEWVGEVFARGPNVLDIATGLLFRLGIFERTVLALTAIHDLHFLRPVKVGDTVRLEIEIENKRTAEWEEQPEGGVVEQRLDLFNQDGELVMSGYFDFVVKFEEDHAY